MISPNLENSDCLGGKMSELEGDLQMKTEVETTQQDKISQSNSSKHKQAAH